MTHNSSDDGRKAFDTFHYHDDKRRTAIGLLIMQDKRTAFGKYKQNKAAVLQSDKPIKYIHLKMGI